MTTRRRGKLLDGLRAQVGTDLAQADKRFKRDPDGIVALEMIQAAVAAGVALPPALGRWLDARINDYLGGEADTLDRAFGLVPKPGDDSARNKRRERASWGGPLAQVHLLASLGATIPDAVHMVAAVTGKSTALLERKYRDLDRRAQRKRDGAQLRTLHISEIEQLLAPYPEDLQSRLTKNGILAGFLR